MTNPEATGDLPRVLRGDAVGNTMYSESWILRQLIKITKYISGEEEFNEEFESDLCNLWDMCADKEVIAFTKKHGLVALATNAIMKSQFPRLTEIMVGIIGNMCTSKSVREECKQRTDVIRVMMELLAFPDSPTLIQVMRVLQTFAWEVSNTSFSPRERRNEDGHQNGNNHNGANHNNDNENDYDMDDEVYYYVERDAAQNANDTNNPSHKLETDSSEESSLSEMEVTHTLPTSSKKSGHEVDFSTDMYESDGKKAKLDVEGGKSFPSTSATIQSHGSTNENESIASSVAGEETKKVVEEIEYMIVAAVHETPDVSTGDITESVTRTSADASPSDGKGSEAAEEMIIPCKPKTPDVSTDDIEEAEEMIVPCKPETPDVSPDNIEEAEEIIIPCKPKTPDVSIDDFEETEEIIIPSKPETPDLSTDNIEEAEEMIIPCKPETPDVSSDNIEEAEEMVIPCIPETPVVSTDEITVEITGISADATSSDGKGTEKVHDEAEEMIIPCKLETPDTSTDEITDAVPGTSADTNASDVAGPSACVASTSGMGNVTCLEGSGSGASCSSAPSGTSGIRRCAGYAWRNIDDNDYEDDDGRDDENPEVVAVSVNDDSVIVGTAFLWYEQFLKVENWLPEIVYILNSSKNAELIGVTWALLAILGYVRVGNSYLCCKFTGPDMMRGLLESFKEFFGHYADLDNSEFHDVLKCRKGLFSWTSVMYSFTLHEDCENSCSVYKGDVMKNIFQMLTFFNNFLPVDGELHEYLIHTYTILDHVLMEEPYEMSSFRFGINTILQVLDDLTEEKKKQDDANASPRHEGDAIDTTRRYLLNVFMWLCRMQIEDRFWEFEDVRDKLVARRLG